MIERSKKMHYNEVSSLSEHYLQHGPGTNSLFVHQTDIMRNEFERLAARQPIELLSMKR